MTDEIMLWFERAPQVARSIRVREDAFLKRAENAEHELAQLRRQVAKALSVLGECDAPCGYMREMAEALRGE